MNCNNNIKMKQKVYYTDLYAGLVGEQAGLVGEYAGLVGEYAGDVGLDAQKYDGENTTTLDNTMSYETNYEG